MERKENTFMYAFIIVVVSWIVIFSFWMVALKNWNTADKKVTHLENIVEKAREKIDKADNKGTDTDQITTSTKPFDEEVLEFVVEYNTAQGTYITLLQGLLKNNNVQYPEFAYERLLNETIN